MFLTEAFGASTQDDDESLIHFYTDDCASDRHAVRMSWHLFMDLINEAAEDDADRIRRVRQRVMSIAIVHCEKHEGEK